MTTAALAAKSAGAAHPTRVGAAVWLLAPALGAAQALAVAPLHVTVALPIAFGGLFLLLERTRSLRSAFTLGWLFGAGSFLVGLSWITEAFAVDAARFGALAWPALVALSAGLGLFTALSLATARVLAGDRGGAPLAAALVATWAAGEWLRGMILTGFPWNIAGYAWGASDTLLQVTALIGIHGAGLFAATAGILPALAIRERRIWPLVLAALLLAGAWSYGTLHLATATPDPVAGVRLRIVQPNIAQDLKWAEGEREAILARLLSLSAKAAESTPPPTHVIWPESAVPYIIAEAPAIRTRLAAVAPPDGALLTGAVRRSATQEGRPALLNSIVALDARGRITAAYNKIRLVPFGEYQPLRRILAALPKLTVGEIDFIPGGPRRVLSVAGLPPAWPLICYEAIFPTQPPAGEAAPGWILTVTNDAWFGTSWGPYQHALAARVRGIELGLPVVRAANSGISFVSDGYGREVARLPLAATGVLDVALPGAIAGGTLYARWGDAPFALTLMLLAAAAVAVRRRS